MKEINDLLGVINKLNEQEKQINNLKSDLLKINELKSQINNLKSELARKDSFIKSTPELSQTALGRSTSDGKIIYRNWSQHWTTESNGLLDQLWFSRFIKYRWPNEDYKLNFFSVWNKHYNIKEEMEGKKIFYTAECLNIRFPEFVKNYGSHALDYVDLGLGYDLINRRNYLRFPYWINTSFGPEQSKEDIEKTFESWNSLNFTKTDDVACINRHDKWNTRTLICNDVEKFTNIDYAGAWRKNTDELLTKYNNNKYEYLKKFKFNICAENLVSEGYVTEKIFDAIKSDCIPLYIGGGETIEPHVLNEKAILRWEVDKDNSDTVELFKNLITDEKSYNEFKDQNVLLDSAPKVASKKISELERAIGLLIEG